MKLSKILRRFLLPSIVVTAYCLLKYKSKISPKAEVGINENLKIGSGSVVSSFVKIKPNGPMQIGVNVTLVVLLIVAMGGCKQGEGDRCQVDSDCATGLVCVIEAGDDRFAGGICGQRFPDAGTPDSSSGDDGSTDS